MIVYGRNPVREALRGKRTVDAVWATERALREEWVRAAGAQPLAPAEIEERCQSPDHQGVCARATEYPYSDGSQLLAADDALVVALDEVQDPQNLGAVCRVAEAAGVSGVVLPERRSAEVTPAACKASAGAVEHLEIARVRNLADWIRTAKEAGAWAYGAEVGERSVGYAEPDYRGRVVLVLGSEESGLRPRVASACDALVCLPQRGSVSSLNVATAAAALLYGIVHLRTELDKAT